MSVFAVKEGLQASRKKCDSFFHLWPRKNNTHSTKKSNMSAKFANKELNQNCKFRITELRRSPETQSLTFQVDTVRLWHH